MKRGYVGILAVLLTFAAPAMADDETGEEGCVGGEEAAWKSPEEAVEVAKTLNYANISKVIIENGCYEVVTINSDGKIVGVQLDPVTLALYKIEDPR
jgi:hypothetical protein